MKKIKIICLVLLIAILSSAITLPALSSRFHLTGRVRSLMDDVSPDDWYYNDIAFVLCLIERDFFYRGLAVQKFYPNKDATREEIIDAMHSIELPVSENEYWTVYDNYKEENYKDHPWYGEDGIYMLAAAWAKENGIAVGFPDGLFHPKETLTREQMMTFVYRYAQYKGYDVSARGDLSKFDDAYQVGEWAEEEMSFAVGAGLMIGRPNNRLDPKANVTKAEYFVVLSRLIQKFDPEFNDGNFVMPDFRPALDPDAPDPEVTEPEVTEPEVTEPEVTEPEVTEHEVTEPTEDPVADVVNGIVDQVMDEISDKEIDEDLADALTKALTNALTNALQGLLSSESIK